MKKISLRAFLREVLRFDSLPALIAQIEADIARAAEVIEAPGARLGVERLAQALDELCTEALTGAPKAREALVAAAVFLAIRHDSPLLTELRELARALPE